MLSTTKIQLQRLKNVYFVGIPIHLEKRFASSSIDTIVDNETRVKANRQVSRNRHGIMIVVKVSVISDERFDFKIL